MKKILTLSTILILTFSLNGQDISGFWQGVLYQQSGVNVNFFPFSMTLDQNGSDISGTSEIRSSGNLNFFAVISLSGILNDTTFQFQEITILDQLTDGSSSWCIKGGNLEYDSTLQKFEGSWEAPNCNPGTIELFRLAIISDTIFCSNELTQLEVTGQNVKWYSDEGLTDSLHSGNTYTPLITTSTTFYITQTHYNTESPSIQLTVIVNPEPTIDNVIISQNGCEITNGTIDIIASSGTGQLEYSIDGNNYYLSNSFENLASGNYSIYIRDSVGCINVQENVLVTNNPLPSTSITGDLEICEGENSILQASGGTNFLWNNGQTTTSITVNSPDTYSVTLTDAFGCEAYDSVFLIVNQHPLVNLILQKDSFCIDDESFQLSGGTPLGGFYSEGGNNIDSINPMLLGEGLHNITYNFSDQNGCSDSASQEILVENISCTTSLSEIERSQLIKISPNPAFEFLNIQVKEITSKFSIRLFNIQGNLVYSDWLSSESIWIGDLPKGIYFIKIYNGDYFFTKKIIFQ